MNEITKEKIKLTSRQFFLTFLDAGIALHNIFDRHGLYRMPTKKYQHFRENDRAKFHQQLYRLKREGFIKKYFEGKEEYVELTTKGKEKLRNIIIQEIKISHPNKWDGKWRIVIFDISNDKKNERDMIRAKLERLGFIKLQESVYVYPFDCAREIRTLKQMYCLDPHILYIKADRIETETNLIKIFYDNEVLTDNHLA